MRLRQPRCRHHVTGDDWQLPELQTRYAGHFSPYIQRRIDEALRRSVEAARKSVRAAERRVAARLATGLALSNRVPGEPRGVWLFQ